MDPLDDKLRSAMQALEASATPRGYFDELPGLIDARLEGSMQMSENDQGADSTGAPPVRTEDSGVHDIKALARSTRQRISRRQTSQHDIDESLLSSSNSGMHAIALPDPAKMISLPSPEEARALSQSMSMRAAADPDAPATASAKEPIAITSARTYDAGRDRAPAKGVPVWLWAGGGLAVAAAAVAAFVFLGKGDDAKQDAAGADNTVAMREDVGSAAGSSAQRMEESKPAAPAKADDAVTVTGLADPDATGGAGTAAGSGAVVAEVPADAADKAAESDNEVAKPTGDTKSKKHSAGSGSASGSGTAKVEVKKDGGTGAGSGSGSSVKVAPPDDKTGGDKGSSKGSAKGSGTAKEGGAVLGAGDDDELGIGDAIKGGDKGGDDDKPKKTELTSRELRAGLDAVLPKAKACYDGNVGTVKVKLTVASTGKITKAAASGDLAGTPAASCVVDAIKGAEFPAWTGAPMSTTYAVLLSD